ncbi:PucR family transcriptional regulator [Oceanobacillus sp. ISL-74]|uniref:PucR family transcriptional regulator n=1 Tax=Oceanobacillus sp. ISL-74 TaxID=2819162 RepID=UPI001BEAD25E|nr:PucR family transcriptional regulator [Oceanobacillus sp. ISL-74]MBT2599418.1 PucR family transcriptional regulator ligand-binding domain-containing protein [Oceanobacillus sp. ISL-74]
MGLTVEDVLCEDLLMDAEVVTSESLIGKKKVQWISVIELPVENFVRKNEIVLTTAIGCKNDPEQFIKFVKDVIESKAAALMIALGRFIYDIPKEVMAMAEENDFVIIVLPWEIRFANIVETVMMQLTDAESQDRKRSERIQQELLNLILAERDLNDILTFIQDEMEAAVFLSDRFGNLFDKDLYNEKVQQQWKQKVVNGKIPRQQTVQSNNDPLIQKFDLIEGKQSLLQIPILQVSGEPQGYLFVMLPEDEVTETFLTTNRIHIIEHAATTIALWLSKRNAIEETKIRLRSDFVDELAKGYFQSHEEAASRAGLLGYELYHEYVCIVGFAENMERMFERRIQEAHTFDSWKKSMHRYIEEEIIYAATTLERQWLLTRNEDVFLIYLQVEHQTDHEYATDFLDMIDRRLQNLLPDIEMVWGLGKRVKQFSDYHISYQQARTALKIGYRKDKRRTWYDQTGLDRILLNLYEFDDMWEMMKNTITPLINYEAERQMDLIGTFTAFHQYRGNVSQTARSLHLHRQSLLYRLRKIESLTGLSLNNSDHLFLLELCLKTWRIGNEDINASYSPK